MIDASIPLKLTNIDMQQPIQNFGAARVQGAQLRDYAQKSQLQGQAIQQGQLQTQTAQREADEGQKIRDLQSKFDVMDPQGQQGFLQAMQQSGLGHRVPEFATQFAGAAAAKQKLLDDRRLAAATLNEKMASVDKATEENRKNYFATAALHIIGQAPEMRQLSWDALIKKAEDHGWDHTDIPQQVPDDKGLKSLSRITMKPEDRAKLELDESQKDQFGQIKPVLDKLSATPAGGWSTTNHSQAQDKINAAIPPNMVANPSVKEYMEEFAKKKPVPPAIVMGAGGNPRLITGLMTDWRHVRDDYEKKMGGYLAAEGIVSASTFGQNRTGDISLLDQMARAETGSKPTEAQYSEFKSQPGPLGKIAALRERVQNNRLLTQPDVDAIMTELRSQAKINHDTYKSSIDEKKSQAELNGITNPDRVIAPGGTFKQIEDKYSKTWGNESDPKAGEKKEIKTKSGKTFHIEVE